MTDHTVKAFDADVDELARMIAQMHEGVDKELRDSVDALVRNDADLAKIVLSLDDANAAVGRELESKVILLIARRQPVANDLRLIVAMWETAIELSRIGGVARSIVNRASALGDVHPLPESAVWGLRRMTRAALHRLHSAVTSVIRVDGEAAEDLSTADSEIDSIYNSLCRELLTYMMADDAGPSLIHLLFCIKSMGSVGENVANIAGAVHYAVHGRRTVEV